LTKLLHVIRWMTQPKRFFQPLPGLLGQTTARTKARMKTQPHLN